MIGASEGLQQVLKQGEKSMKVRAAAQRKIEGRRASRWMCGALVVGVYFGLGCVISGGDGDGDDGFDPFGLPSQGSDDWEEDVEDRRQERDDPRSADYRGDFEVELRDEVVVTTLDGTSLGEATFKVVEQDLLGTPQHCQLTLADREPDARGVQGYVIVQVFAENTGLCILDERVYDVVPTVEEAIQVQGAVVKTVQVSIETDAEMNFFDYRTSRGELEVLEREGVDLIQAYLDVEMGTLIFNDEDEEVASLQVKGGFGAVAAP